jgi:hypothetical protein
VGEPSIRVFFGLTDTDGLTDEDPRGIAVDRVFACVLLERVRCASWFSEILCVRACVHSHPDWAGNMSDVAAIVIKACRDVADLARLNKDPNAEIIQRPLNVFAYSHPACEAGKHTLKSVKVALMGKRNADCDKATEFVTAKTFDGTFCATPPTNPPAILCPTDVGAVAVATNGNLVGLYLAEFSFTSFRGQATWIAQQVTYDICPKNPPKATPAPTDDGPSILSPIYIGDSNEAGGTKLRGSVEAAQRAAVNIITEAQVKGRLVYLNAVKRALRGGALAHWRRNA